ncbi:MAG: thioredoxin [Ignavibacteriota bacterium]|nr:thioredoxin [Ignavibacteriota bacterium]
MKRYKNIIVVVSLMLGLSVLASCSKKEEPKSEFKTDVKIQGVNNFKNNNKTKMEHLTAATFKSKVFDYEKNKEWKFEGKNPAIIDFYADWCGPCKMVAPVLEELSNEYDGKVDIYKVDTEVEQELASVFGIRSIPSILFVPVSGQPQMSAGAMQKDGFVQAINEILLVKGN